MISKRHNLSIVVNGDELELESQDSINLRMNNTIYNPEKVSVTQSEYSFTFGVPFTPKNNRIFGFANVPSVKGKFVKEYDTYVYADGVEIFKGTLRISSIGESEYKCNLISIKNSSIDEIFGDTKMGDIKWYIPYNGASTQNEYNTQSDPDVFFPLVSYGVFQKDPYFSIASENNELSYYTGTNQLDKWTKYYNETFIPSPKLIEVVKKMIEQRGYTYSGDVFDDVILNKIYLSSSIANDQDPAYNYGGTRGHLGLTFEYERTEFASTAMPTKVTERNLQHPENYHYLKGGFKDNNSGEDIAYVENLLIDGSVENVSNHNMWQDGFIVIPHDGYYKIRMYVEGHLMGVGSINDSYPIFNDRTGELKYNTYQRNRSFNKLPYEIQLVKNNSNELEFISTNRINFENLAGRIDDYYTDYPHEPNLVKTGTKRRSNQPPTATEGEYYFMPKYYTRGYDQSVNPDFVMGVSTATNGWGIAKKGRSFDKEFPDYGYNNYYCDGYSRYVNKDGVTKIDSYTDYQKWDSTDVPQCTYEQMGGQNFNAFGNAIVWLNKNDMLTIKLLTKEYATYANNAPDGVKTRYIPHSSFFGSINIDAWSPNKNDINKSWNGESSFDKDLNIGEFLNDEETQLEFFNNFLTTFNLTCNVEGNNIDIRKNSVKVDSTYAVEVDNRIDLKDVETEIIDFPTSVNVKFTIDDEESGFYHSVPNEHINDDDWKDWADTGSDIVELSRNAFSTNEISKTSKFSRNWMMDFIISDWYTSDGRHIADNPRTITLPIIAKDEDFIDGGDYESMMKVDGRSLKQRMWFKGQLTDYYVPNRNGTKYNDSGELISAVEYLRICTATPYYNGMDVLKFTSDEGTLLTRYFNLDTNTDSNYANIEVYLTPQEYMSLRNGAMVRFDNDRYRLCSITGYDPTGNNRTKLKLMKM